MPTRISEKKVVVGLVCLALAVILFIEAPLVTAPVRVSEKGLLLCVAAAGLLVFAIRSFKQAASKV